MAIVYALVIVVLFLDGPMSLCYERWQYAGSSYALIGAFMVGWPLWRWLAPRPIPALRAIGWGACCGGLTVTFACISYREWAAAYELAIHAYATVALALYAEIARGLLDRRNHRSDLVPEMRSLGGGGRRRRRSAVERRLLAP